MHRASLSNWSFADEFPSATNIHSFRIFCNQDAEQETGVARSAISSIRRDVIERDPLANACGFLDHALQPFLFQVCRQALDK
ncbi:MAG: hypothetical protein ACRECV_09675 [Xanthobacteraceae bacterium]